MQRKNLCLNEEEEEPKERLGVEGFEVAGVQSRCLCRDQRRWATRSRCDGKGGYFATASTSPVNLSAVDHSTRSNTVTKLRSPKSTIAASIVTVVTEVAFEIGLSPGGKMPPDKVAPTSHADR